MAEKWVVVDSQKKDQACSEETSGSVSATYLPNKSISNTQTEEPTTKPSVSNTVDNADVLLLQGDESSDTVSRPLPTSPSLPKESSFTGSESTEQIANEGNRNKEPATVENKDVTKVQEKQNVCVNLVDKKAPMKSNEMISDQFQALDINSRTKGASVDLCPDKSEKLTCTEVII